MTQFIFDTNYYRNYVVDKDFKEFQSNIFEQKKIENQKNYEIVFPIISAIELLNHLNDNNSTAKICFNALNLMVNHCGNIINGKRKGTVVPSFYDLLTMYFFQTTSENHIFNNNIFSLSQTVANSLDYNVIKTIENEINQVIKIKREERENIIHNLQEFYLKSLNNKEEIDWYIFQKNPALKKELQELIKNKKIHKLVGLSFIDLAMKQANKDEIKISQSEFENNFVDSHFKVSIDFFVKHIVSNMINIEKMEYFFKPETDSKKRWNSFYDMQLIFAVEFENFKNRNTIFVTEERKIRDCFKINGKENLAISLVQYENLLKT